MVSHGNSLETQNLFAIQDGSMYRATPELGDMFGASEPQSGTPTKHPHALMDPNSLHMCCLPSITNSYLLLSMRREVHVLKARLLQDIPLCLWPIQHIGKILGSISNCNVCPYTRICLFCFSFYFFLFSFFAIVP